MPYTPDDPRRYREKEFEHQLVEAHVRIFEIAREQSEEIRRMLLEAQMEEPSEREQLANRVTLETVRWKGVDGMSVKVRISTQASQNLEGKRQVVRVRQQEEFAELQPRMARTVFQLLDPDSRSAIATYLAAVAHKEAEDDLDTIEEYETLQFMQGLIEELRERIIAGKLPVPAPTIRFTEEPDYYGVQPGKLRGI